MIENTISLLARWAFFNLVFWWPQSIREEGFKYTMRLKPKGTRGCKRGIGSGAMNLPLCQKVANNRGTGHAVEVFNAIVPIWALKRRSRLGGDWLSTQVKIFLKSERWERQGDGGRRLGFKGGMIARHRFWSRERDRRKGEI